MCVLTGNPGLHPELPLCEDTMSYIKIRFGTGFDQSPTVGRSIEEVFQSMSPMFALSQRNWKPQMDIHETAEAIIILAEIAGVEKENLEVEISSKAVRVHGCRHGIMPEQEASYRLAEIQYGCFERILFLPSPINTDDVTAHYNNGILEIRLAKLPTSRLHRIPVNCD